MFTSIRLSVGRFFKRNKRIIFAILLIWLIIILINNFLKDNKLIDFERTTYNEHKSVMEGNEKVPEILRQPINELVDTYFNYCNTKQYEKAYEMLSKDCKSIYYPTLDDFKEYVDLVFNEEKIYYMQNFSNKDNVYVYRIRITENILKTGLTGKKDVYYYEEKISITKEGDKLVLSIRQFINTENVDEVYEDAYMKIWIEKKEVYYENEVYVLKIKNKTQNTIVLADGTEDQEIILQVGSQKRTPLNDNLGVIIQPEQTEEFKLAFTKFYDEENIVKGINFNTVRVLKTYSGTTISRDDEMKNAEKLYSINIGF